MGLIMQIGNKVKAYGTFMCPLCKKFFEVDLNQLVVECRNSATNESFHTRRLDLTCPYCEETRTYEMTDMFNIRAVRED